ncbi:XRE family transcriptional regulator [Hymenobacter setariae]|uniref:XRE family transcriptional regulator n=1 Tax=Hymenobacter setariae TaxID=2594794 RepID=A0A558BJT4_9BACT|nr:XRE family transcriptional regulator [Hymenobacter setariae]TVT36756.1 XRE family transcriptional regulator [Hymenobacter setariae]
MLYQVDTQLLASLVRTKRGGQTLREAAEEISKTIGPVSVGTLLRVEQQRLPDLPVFLHFCNWLDVSPARLLSCPSSTGTAPAETTAAKVARLLRSDARLALAMANVLAIMIEATYAQLATHE